MPAARRDGTARQDLLRSIYAWTTQLRVDTMARAVPSSLDLQGSSWKQDDHLGIGVVEV